MASQIELTGIKHVFDLGKVQVPVLHGIDIVIEAGEFVALCGSSGSGKSTLLNLMGGLVKPTEGTIVIGGQDITKLNENQLCVLRQKSLGFIFQSYNILPHLTAQENVELPLIFAGTNLKERRERAKAMLDLVGLGDRLEHKPNELSGGQQQRVSIARALVNNPKVILADEPTGNLDSKTEADILRLLVDLNQRYGSTLVVVTHDKGVADMAHRTVMLKDGLIESDTAAAGKEVVDL